MTRPVLLVLSKKSQKPHYILNFTMRIQYFVSAYFYAISRKLLKNYNPESTTKTYRFKSSIFGLLERSCFSILEKTAPRTENRVTAKEKFV
jgi:hypothetical protein